MFVGVNTLAFQQRQVSANATQLVCVKLRRTEWPAAIVFRNSLGSANLKNEGNNDLNRYLCLLMQFLVCYTENESSDNLLLKLSLKHRDLRHKVY